MKCTSACSFLLVSGLGFELMFAAEQPAIVQATSETQPVLAPAPDSPKATEKISRPTKEEIARKVRETIQSAPLLYIEARIFQRKMPGFSENDVMSCRGDPIAVRSWMSQDGYLSMIYNSEGNLRAVFSGYKGESTELWPTLGFGPEKFPSDFPCGMSDLRWPEADNQACLYGNFTFRWPGVKANDPALNSMKVAANLEAKILHGRQFLPDMERNGKRCFVFVDTISLPSWKDNPNNPDEPSLILDDQGLPTTEILEETILIDQETFLPTAHRVKFQLIDRPRDYTMTISNEVPPPDFWEIDMARIKKEGLDRFPMQQDAKK